MKGDVDAVFDRWVADVRSDKKSLYLYDERRRHLEYLMGYLITNEIEMDDAKFLRNKVVDILVHEEGKKGKGKYKDWVQNVLNDFDDCIQLTYVEGLSKSGYKSKPDYKQDPEIVKWAMDKFGPNIPPKVLKDCHTIGNSLYFLFIEEFYNHRRQKIC